MFWFVYRKGMHSYIDKVWYVKGTTAEEVHADLSEEFDFGILVKADEED